jgi:AraC-like DNA-binding protein
MAKAMFGQLDPKAADYQHGTLSRVPPIIPKPEPKFRPAPQQPQQAVAITQPVEKPRIVRLEDIISEVREYGIARMAREIGCSRRHLQGVCGGERRPGKKLLDALRYRAITHYVDIMPKTP